MARTDVVAINPAAVAQATLVAVLAFVAIDAVLEYLIESIGGVSVLHTFETRMAEPYGVRFHAVNLGLFVAEMSLVMVFYALIRPRFTSRRSPALIAGAVFMLLISLFLGQMVNLGIYPLRTATLFLATTMPAFAASLTAGTYVYDRAVLE